MAKRPDAELEKRLKGFDTTVAGSRATHMGFAQWHLMLAEMEGMKLSEWQAFASGQKRPPEVLRAIEHLRLAGQNFQLAAAGCITSLEAYVDPGPDSPAGSMYRAYQNENVRVLKEIGNRVEDMASRLEKGDVPSIEYVHGIEDLLRDQHMAMDRATTALGALNAISPMSR